MSRKDEIPLDADAANDEQPVDPAVSEHMRKMSMRRWGKGRARAALHEALSGGEPHPLFPTEPNEPIPEIQWINVVRYEPGRGPVDCPRVFPAEELQQLEDISAQFGGGSYELRGRCAGFKGLPGPIVRRQRYNIPGDPIPFVIDDYAPPAGALAVPSATPAAGNDPTALVIAMMAESAKEARASSERQMQLVIAMMQGQAQQQTASMNALATLMATAIGGGNKGPDIVGLMTAMAGMSNAQLSAIVQMMPKQAATDPIEGMAKVLELAKGVNKGADEDSAGSLLGGFAAAASAIAEVEKASAEGKKAEAQAAVANAEAAHIRASTPTPSEHPAAQVANDANGKPAAPPASSGPVRRGEADALGS